MQQPTIESGKASRILLFLNSVIALVYFSWWFLPSHIGNPYLYGLLFLGELYHVLIGLTFWYTIWPKRRKEPIRKSQLDPLPFIAVFITVAGEPVSVVEKTAAAALNMEYPPSKLKVYILNDGYVAGKDNWRDMEQLAQNMGIACLTRKTGGGAKAGNVNFGLRNTRSDIVVLFDADMVPHRDFLKKTIPYMADPQIAFVQTPQYYKNFSASNTAAGAWEQQELFFGPIMEGKSRDNATFICGTNVIIRRSALEAAGGMYEKNIAEDFLTSLFIHEKGWKSVYVKEVLSEGLAPEDLMAYYKQQHRWARGSLEVLFSFNPLLRRGLTPSQKIHYLSSALFYFNGIVVLIDILMPLLFLIFGIKIVSATTASFAFFFFPFMFLTLYNLYRATGQNLTFRALSFTYSSFTLQINALKAVLFHETTAFAVTPKKKQRGSFLFLAYPHIIYMFLTAIGLYLSLSRSGLGPATVTNTAWAVFNCIMFSPFIAAALSWNNSWNAGMHGKPAVKSYGTENL